MNKHKLKLLSNKERRNLVDKYYRVLLKNFYVIDSTQFVDYNELLKSLKTVKKVKTRLKRLLDIEKLNGLHCDQLKWSVNRLEYYGQLRDSVLSKYVYNILCGNPWAYYEAQI